MLGENALSIMTGPSGLMLFAAALCAVMAVRAWRSVSASKDQPSENEPVQDEVVGEVEFDLSRVPARGLRRTTRGPRVFDPEEQEQVLRDMAYTARGKARSAQGKGSKVA